MIDEPKSTVKLVDVDGDKRKKEMSRLSKWTVNFGKYKKKRLFKKQRH